MFLQVVACYMPPMALKQLDCQAELQAFRQLLMAFIKHFMKTQLLKFRIAAENFFQFFMYGTPTFSSFTMA
jgi:hypothetical protein